MNIKSIRQVFSVLISNYKQIPLEVYKKDSYKILISTLLSSRTNDDITLKAANRLFNKAHGFEDLAKLSIEEIRALIYPVGFYKTKSVYLIKLANLILFKHKGKVPKNREQLMSLPGVGRKTANLVLNRAFDVPAIAVDTHVHRITNLIGWVNTKTPFQTELELMKILPKSYWSETNKLFVSLGRQFRSNTKLKEFLLQNKIIELPK